MYDFYCVRFEYKHFGLTYEIIFLNLVIIAY